MSSGCVHCLRSDDTPQLPEAPAEAWIRAMAKATCGPGDAPNGPIVLWSYEGSNGTLAQPLADWLRRLGFLRREPGSPDPTWYVNFRWQWRFWRGAYRDAALAMGLKPPRWRDVALNGCPC